MAAASDRDLATQLADEVATIAQLIVGADGTEGVNAFLEKRAQSSADDDGDLRSA